MMIAAMPEYEILVVPMVLTPEWLTRELKSFRRPRATSPAILNPNIPGVPDRTPDPVRRRRHVEVRDARLPQRIQHRVHQRRERAAHACFAHAFRAERVRRRRHRMLVDRQAV